MQLLKSKDFLKKLILVYANLNTSCETDFDCVGFKDTSTLAGHFVSSPREREKRDRRDSRRDERKGQGRKRNRSESEETEETRNVSV